MKKTIKNIGIVLMLICSFWLTSMTVNAAGPNYLGFDPTVQHVTIGDTFYTDIYADISSEIDSCAADNLSYTSGIVNFTTLTQGDLFGGQTMWLTPMTDGTISNSSGYAEPTLWTYTGGVNSVNNTFVNITWSAYDCGMATLNISDGGTALSGSDPGTTRYNGTIYVHPKQPGSLTASQYNQTQINLSFTTDTGIDRFIVERNTSSSWSRGQGTEVCNTTDTSFDDTGLSEETQYYYQIWSYNSTAGLYSLSYQSDDATTTSYNIAPDTPSSPVPSNQTEWIEAAYLNCTVTDDNADSMTVSFYWANNDSLIDTDTDVANNTVASISYTPARYENITWYVIVNDSVLETTGPTWWFVMEAYDWDINRDAECDYLDASSLTSHYGESGDAGWIRDDINEDGDVDYLDASSLTSHYGESY